MSDSTNRKRQPSGITTGGQFATEPKSETGVTLPAPAAKPDAHGGFRLTKIRTMNGREGIAFSGTLVENDKPVAEVIQDGNGGITRVRWHGGWRTEASERFDAVAKDVCGSAHEPDESLIHRLLSVDEMNRKRSVCFIQDGDDFWGEGAYRQIPGASNQRAAVLAFLSGPKNAGRNIRVWDKDAGDFIPVDEATAKA